MRLVAEQHGTTGFVETVKQLWEGSKACYSSELGYKSFGNTIYIHGRSQASNKVPTSSYLLYNFLYFNSALLVSKAGITPLPITILFNSG